MVQQHGEDRGISLENNSQNVENDNDELTEVRTGGTDS